MIFGYVEHSILRRCMLKYLKVKCHDICNLHFNGLANIYIYLYTYVHIYLQLFSH